LDGLAKNIKKFKELGIDAYQIIVIVIFDGLDKMDKSILDLFDQYDIMIGLDEKIKNGKVEKKLKMKQKYEDYVLHKKYVQDKITDIN
jgi:hypothetical protein